MKYGFRFSQPGKDALTCPPKDLIMSSEFPSLKIIEMGEVPFSITNSVNLIVPHSVPLPFIVKAFYYSDAVEGWKAVSEIQFDDTYLYFYIVDTDTINNPVLDYFIFYA